MKQLSLLSSEINSNTVEYRINFNLKHMYKSVIYQIKENIYVYQLCTGQIQNITCNTLMLYYQY